MDEEEKETKQKKRPGRPRKNPRKVPIEIKGIINEPDNKDHSIELYYHNPNNFKKIIQFLYQESVTDLTIIFTKKEMIWISNDSLTSKSRIKLVVDGSKVNRYYCKTPQEFTINFDDLKLLGDKLDSSSYNAITIFMLEKKARPAINFTLETSIKIDEYTQIQVTNPKYNIINFTSADKIFSNCENPDIYCLSFSPLGKYLKKMILDVKNSGKTLEIRKVGSGQLEFRYASNNGRVHERRIVRDPKKFDVISHIAKESIFSTSVFVDHIKPLTTLLTAADNIIVYCSSSAPLIFKISIEKGVFTLMITVTIVDFRDIPRNG